MHALYCQIFSTIVIVHSLQSCDEPTMHTHTHTHTQLVEDWNIDAGSYSFKKLDVTNQDHKKTINEFLLWEGDFGGKEVADGKIFK